MSFVAAHPRMVAIAQKKAKVEAAHAASRARAEAVMAPYWKAEAEWKTKAGEALLAGKTPPPRPVQPDLGADADAAAVFMAELGGLRDEERRVSREIAPEVVEAVDGAVPDLTARTAKAVAALGVLAKEWAGLASDLNRVGHRVGPVTLTSVIAATLAGQSPLGEVPNPTSPIVRDDSPVVQRTATQTDNLGEAPELLPVRGTVDGARI